MKKYILSALLAAGILALILAGCGKKTAPQPEESQFLPDPESVSTTEATIPATIPPDGNPHRSEERRVGKESGS